MPIKILKNMEYEREIIKSIEAILFSTSEPISTARLSNALSLKGKDVKNIIGLLNQEYITQDHAFRIKEIAGGFVIKTLPEFSTTLNKIFQRANVHLSRAAMITLAIIAYRQPITKAEVSAIRGISSDSGIINKLLDLGLIKIVGKKDIIGHPFLYETTKAFLKAFNLKSLKDLPEIEEENSSEGQSE